MKYALPTPRHEINQQMLQYWLLKKGGRTMPARKDFHPTEVPRLLPHIVLVDVEHNPRDFVYRLIGTSVEYHLQRNLTGLRMSGIPHQKPGSKMWSVLESIVDEKRPASSSIPYVGPHKDFTIAEDLILPLSNDDKEVNMLLVTVAYEMSDEAKSAGLDAQTRLFI